VICYRYLRADERTFPHAGRKQRSGALEGFSRTDGRAPIRSGKPERTARYRGENRNGIAQSVPAWLFAAEPGKRRQIPARGSKTGATARHASAAGVLENGLQCAHEITPADGGSQPPSDVARTS